MPAPDNALILIATTLAERQSQLNQILERARRLVDGLDEDRFNQRSSAGGWSVGLCLEHLNITNRLYDQRIPGRLVKGRERGKLHRGPDRIGWFGRWFIDQLEPPPKSRFRTPKKFRPDEQARVALEPTMTEFERHRKLLGDLFVEADDLDLTRIKMPSPVMPMMVFNMAEVFGILLAHDRRHLYQAEQVKAQL